MTTDKGEMPTHKGKVSTDKSKSSTRKQGVLPDFREPSAQSDSGFVSSMKRLMVEKGSVDGQGDTDGISPENRKERLMEYFEAMKRHINECDPLEVPAIVIAAVHLDRENLRLNLDSIINTTRWMEPFIPLGLRQLANERQADLEDRGISLEEAVSVVATSDKRYGGKPEKAEQELGEFLKGDGDD